MDYKYKIDITSYIDEVSHTTLTKKAWMLNGEKIVSAAWGAFKKPLQNILNNNRDEIFVTYSYFGDKSFLNIVEISDIHEDRLAADFMKRYVVFTLYSNNPNVISKIKLIV